MAGGCTFLNSPRNLVREFCEPLRIPYIVDAAWLDVTILHVKKRGCTFMKKPSASAETVVSTSGRTRENGFNIDSQTRVSEQRHLKMLFAVK